MRGGCRLSCSSTLVLLLLTGSSLFGIAGGQQQRGSGDNNSSSTAPPSLGGDGTRSGSNSTSKSYLSRPGTSYLLSIGASQGDIATLFHGKPVVGVLRPGEERVLQFAVQEVEGHLPDVLLTVTIVSDGGDADVYCRSLRSLADWPRLAGPLDYIWKSNHTSGKDYVFISRDDPEYNLLNLTVENGARIATGAAFSCSIVGSRRPLYDSVSGATEFKLSLDVDYTRRSLAADERRLAASIFRSCCKEKGNCRPWKALPHSPTEVTETGISIVNPFIKGATLDLCRIRGNVCNRDGKLLRLSMPGFDLRCSFPTDEILGLSMLEKLELGHNKLSGDIDRIVLQMQSVENRIEHFGLSNNGLTTHLFAGASNRDTLNFCTFVKGNLSFLDLRNNFLSRPIRGCIFAPESNLEELHLSGNPITRGSMPGGFSEESKIRVINLASTGIDGTIPESLGNASRLQILDVSGNNLTGTIPDNIGASPRLEFLNLAKNKLVGSVPSSLAKSKSLRTLWGHQNQLDSLPKEWKGKGKAQDALTDVILAGNRIEGKFPVPLARAENLLRFHLAGNRLKGPLPIERNLFPKAVYVDFSRNKFVGKFPPAWSTLGMFSFDNTTDPTLFLNRVTNETTVSILDFSNNSLIGTIPRFLVDAQFTQRVRIYVTGNKGLTCPYIVGVPCGQIFNSSENVAGRLAEINPNDVDESFAELKKNESELSIGRIGRLSPLPSPFGQSREEVFVAPPDGEATNADSDSNELSLTVSIIAAGLIILAVVVATSAYCIGLKSLKNSQDIEADAAATGPLRHRREDEPGNSRVVTLYRGYPRPVPTREIRSGSLHFSSGSIDFNLDV